MKMRRLFVLSVFLLFIIIVFLQIWFYFISLPWWSLQELVILNNSYIPQQRIVAEMQLPLKISIFRISKKQLQNKLRRITQLEHVVIRRQFPATLLVDVTAKTPYLILKIKDHGWVIDDQGDILNRDEIVPQLPQNIIAVSGLSSLALIDGLLPEINKLAGAIYLYLAKEKITMDFQDKDNINLYLADGIFVKIGEPLHFTEKIRNLQYVLQRLEQRRYRVAYIDMRAFQNPVVKMK